MLSFYTSISLDYYLEYTADSVTLYLDIILQHLPIRQSTDSLQFYFVSVTGFLLKVILNVH